ncbi:MAG: hypothetical protein U1F52_05055 [Burkholderiales bacterium]
MNGIKRICVAILIGIAGTLAHAADEASVGIKVRKQSGINYVTGGNGDEADAFREIAPRYPVQMIFLVDGKHVEISDVKVRLLDIKGESQIEAVATGPMFFINPPSGRWTFEATWKGQTISQTKDLTGRRYLVLDINFKNPE